MGFIGSSEHIFEVVNAATERFQGKRRLNTTRYKVLDPVCDMMDSFASYFRAEYFDVDVDDAGEYIEITTALDELVLQGAGATFFATFARMFDSVDFKKDPEGDRVLVALRINDMWEKIDEQ